MIKSSLPEDEPLDDEILDEELFEEELSEDELLEEELSEEELSEEELSEDELFELVVNLSVSDTVELLFGCDFETISSYVGTYTDVEPPPLDVELQPQSKIAKTSTAQDKNFFINITSPFPIFV